MSPENFKKVDEDWKAQVEREKNAAPAEPRRAASGPAPAAPGGKAAPAPRPKAAEPKPSQEFAMFLSSLAMQAYMALGEETDLGPGRLNPPQAKYLIDVLGMLQEKTAGNLSPEEASMLEAVVYELRLKYVEKQGL